MIPHETSCSCGSEWNVRRWARTVSMNRSVIIAGKVDLAEQTSDDDADERHATDERHDIYEDMHKSSFQEALGLVSIAAIVAALWDRSLPRTAYPSIWAGKLRIDAIAPYPAG